jgi:hypothetical protein
MSSRSEKKHSTGSSGSSGSAKMPKEAIKFAKRLGVDLNGFELEAEELWKKLDDMAAHRPVEYQAFMDQQYQYQMEEEANKQNPQSAQQQANNPTKKKQQQQPQFPQSSLFPSNANESAKYFRPDAGFCIQTHTTGGNDGLKIRGMGKDKKGKTLYINFCSHAAIDLPMVEESQEGANSRTMVSALTSKRTANQMQQVKLRWGTKVGWTKQHSIAYSPATPLILEKMPR